MTISKRHLNNLTPVSQRRNLVLESSMIASFEGVAPEITEPAWRALLAERARLGRVLSDAEAREVIRDACI